MTEKQIIELVTLAFSDYFEYGIVAGAAYLIFWKLLKQRLIHKFLHKVTPKKESIRREMKYSLFSIFIFKACTVLIVLAYLGGYTQLYEEISDMGWTYYFFSFLIILLIHDTYFYWSHRFMHHPKIYKYVHRVHHQSVHPSPWAAYAFHPWEALITFGIVPLLVFCIPLHLSAIMIFFLFSMIRNVIGHLGFEIFPKGFTKNKWLNWSATVTHHNQHHEKFHGNYGFYFTVWDKLMKTEAANYESAFEEVASRPPRKKEKLKIKSTSYQVE
ncbi:MAG: sterol desaturase family protein [Flavobacteriales bacterium]|nr:sterol desaturase family protein [Flavobacteriales bacterium]